MVVLAVVVEVLIVVCQKKKETLIEDAQTCFKNTIWATLSVFLIEKYVYSNRYSGRGSRLGGRRRGSFEFFLE